MFFLNNEKIYKKLPDSSSYTVKKPLKKEAKHESQKRNEKHENEIG
jgi:hypothetical protein